MAEIAWGAGAEIVAERVETTAEADALRLLGIHYGRGWLFGRPGPLPNREPRTTVAPRAEKVESWKLLPRRRG